MHWQRDFEICFDVFLRPHCIDEAVLYKMVPFEKEDFALFLSLFEI